MPEIILAVTIVLLLAERVWERVWAETPPEIQGAPDQVHVPYTIPQEPEPVYVARRPIPPEAEWDGYEGQAGIS